MNKVSSDLTTPKGSKRKTKKTVKLATMKVPKDILDCARFASFSLKPTGDKCDRWVAALCEHTMVFESMAEPRERKRTQKALESFSRAVGAFACDLIKHSGNAEAQGFMYRPADREWLGDTLVSSDNFDMLLRWWNNMGWVEVSSSIDARTNYEGTRLPYYQKARRMRATKAFLDIAAAHYIDADKISDHSRVSHRHIDVIEVRADKKQSHDNPIRGKRRRSKSPKQEAEKAKLIELNEFLDKHSFSLKDQPRLRRIFSRGEHSSFDFDMGGRFYSGSDDNWVNMPPEDRAKILIDGQATVEIDVRASHLSILYALDGQRLPEGSDPYKIGSYERWLIKKLVVVIMGQGKRPPRWPKGLADEFRAKTGQDLKKTYTLKAIVEAIYERHPVLETLVPYCLDWARLQYEEAECFLSAMRQLARPFDIPFLPVHDSLIVRRRDAEIATDTLRNAYYERLGFRPEIKEKSPSSDDQVSEQ